MASSFALLSGLLLCVLWVVRRLAIIGRREPFLPPGPPTIPLLGNLLICPTAWPWYKLTEFAREYGEIYSLKVSSQTMIVIASVPAVREIMDKNSGLVSDRPPSLLLDQVVGENSLSFAHYSQGWRTLRKSAREILTFQACQNHLGIQQAEAIQLMYDLTIKPKDFYTSIRRYGSSVILSVLYGKRAPQSTTKEVVKFYEAQHSFELLAEPGSAPPLDLLPILQYIPERFARWKRLAKKVKGLHQELYFDLLDDVKHKIDNRMTNGCWMETIIERGPQLGLNRQQMGYLGGVLIEGGSDTTAAFLQTAILALVIFPEAQRAAQAEIDRVIGPNRVPVVTDIEELPYVQALIKEIHRWRPISPLSVPHASIAPVQYKDYIIPQGATIIVNTWAMMHDPEVFEEPSKFDPSRWLTPGLVNDKTHDFVFGYARRVCPGQHLAKNSVNLNTMNFVWGFDFLPAKDKVTGKDKVYDPFDFARGLFTAPNPFECIIAPRTPHHEQLIKKEFLAAAHAFAPFEHDLDAEDKEFVTRTREDLKASLAAEKS